MAYETGQQFNFGLDHVRREAVYRWTRICCE